MSSSDDELSAWARLPQVIFDLITLFLGDVDMCGYLPRICRAVQLSESCFQALCTSVFARQLAHAKFDLSNWGSWRSMLVRRPRLRLNGLYTMKTLFTKAYSNDAFWEEKRYQSIEVVYFRHFRFFDFGKVLYSLDIIPPHDMFKHFKNPPSIPTNKKICPGTYVLHRRNLLVEVDMPYCKMVFTLELKDAEDGYYHGNFNRLELQQHYSRNTITNRDDETIVHYPIPIDNVFKFFRNWDFSSPSDDSEKRAILN